MRSRPEFQESLHYFLSVELSGKTAAIQPFSRSSKSALRQKLTFIFIWNAATFGGLRPGLRQSSEEKKR
jgi:hypothetical protein